MMKEKLFSGLEFDLIHIDDDYDNLYTSSYCILPDGYLLFVFVVE